MSTLSLSSDSAATLVESLTGLASAASAAYHGRIGSDASADAVADVLAYYVENPETDRSANEIARRLSTALARYARAEKRALSLVADRAERSDVTRSVAYETLSEHGKRATAAALTNGDTFAMPIERVDAILAAHSGVANVRSRSVARSVLRSAASAVDSGRALSEALASAVAPVAVDSEAPASRTTGARWAKVSTAGAAHRETASGALGIDAGSIAGIRHRDSDAGNSRFTLAAVRSAESAFLSLSHSETLRAATLAPFSPSAASAAQSAAWEALTATADASGLTLSDYVAEYATDPTFDRNGKRITGARFRVGALASALSEATGNAAFADAASAETKALQRALSAWASAVDSLAYRMRAPQRTQTLGRVTLGERRSGRIVTVRSASDRRVGTRFATANRLPFGALVTLESFAQRAYRAWERSERFRLAGDRSGALSALADAFHGSDRVASFSDRGHGVTDAQVTPTARTARKRGATDPRYLPTADGASVAVSAEWRYRSDAQALALRAWVATLD